MDPFASVVVPTKNGGDRFKAVLGKLLSQETPWPYEILIIDSGSRDGTVELVQAHPEVRLIRINPPDFGHGKTRNQAIGETRSPYVALLTQDAEPVDARWLRNIVTAVDADDKIAGAFGRHLAYPDASAFTKRDLEAHFANFRDNIHVVNRYTDIERYENDEGWRQFLHFFSDNNSCLRRSVWEKIPYPEVEFAEDQIWAETSIKAGYSKAYADDAVVYHSHEYEAFERLQRSFDESKNFNKLFGYKLAPTMISGFRSMMALSARDIEFSRNADGVGTGATLHQLIMNAALVAGHYLGSHHEALPDRVHDFLSRDRALRRS